MASKKHKLVKLHLGCGHAILPGFINIDHQKLTGVNIQCDVRKLSVFKNGSVDLIYASHVLEHFHRHETFSILLEWNRVLKPGGKLRLAVPDWEATVKVYNKTGEYENLMNWIYGSYESTARSPHFRQFTFHGLMVLLIESGFRQVVHYDWRTTEHAKILDYSSAYWPPNDREQGILLSLNVEATKQIYPPALSA